MRNLKTLIFAVSLSVLVLAGISIAPSVFSQDAQGGSKIRGTVTSSAGKPMEGVTVSVRGQNEPYVTTVYTNQKGVYVFPTLGSNMKYSLWAQAQGFQTAKADATPGKPVAALKLMPLKDFSKQMTGVEWMNSFPETTPAEKREKQIFASNCSGCHDEHFALQNRFDSDGWNKIITVMSRDSEGITMNPKNAGQPTMNEYKDELVAFLTKVRGPAPAKYTLKPLPRPTGEAAQVVITEFDVPRPEAPAESYLHNGSDWMDGTPSRWEGRAVHDAAIGNDGNVYFSDDRSMDRTMAKLDPRTGIVTSLKFDAKFDGAAATHGITSDGDGRIWSDSGGNFLLLDPKTQQFKDYPRPADMKATVGGTVAGDWAAYKNMVWATSGDGAMKMDTKTGEYTYFPMPAGHKGTYGITVDRHGNGWYTSPGGDRVNVVDAETGKTSEVIFPPQGPETGMEIREKDKQAYANIRANQNIANPLQVCPRRIGADLNADVVWVGLFCADKIAKIDIQTHKITEYPLPYKYSRPYGVVVDNNHNVWINMLNTDMVGKFDPSTEKFTMFHMPSRGTDMRHMAITKTNPPEVFLPYNRSNKIARIQFRKASDME